MKRSFNPKALAEARRVLLVAAPGSQILDVAGPFQVFTRASEMFLEPQPGSIAPYSGEIITSSPKALLVTICGLHK